ncbi:MAG: zinc ribbon domain-containing protein [Clostridia bacterium]|nr:zinc ribbon domain-containing protein [Clostridia bacterium]
MPLLRYKCPKCGKLFEELVASHADEVTCPNCGVMADRTWNGPVYTATGKPPKKCSGNCKTCPGC